MSKPSKPAARPRAATLPRQVRVIGGQWRRHLLPVPDRPGLRPTPDRVRETLFNWLGQDLTGWRCLDAFAGTGVLGFEAASRGAAQVLMLEHDAGLVTQLLATKSRLEAAAVQVQRGDAVMVLKKTLPGSQDLIFLDPPFDSDLFDKALSAAAQAVAAEGFIYLEAPTAWTDALLQPFGLQQRRHLKAGAVHAHLLVRAVPSASNEETTP